MASTALLPTTETTALAAALANATTEVASAQPPIFEVPPIALLGIAFDNVTLSKALAQITEMIESRRTHYVVTANVDFLTQARTDPELRSILLDADLVIGDGMPIIWASWLLRNPLPERVAGADLVPQLIALAAQRGYRLFFLGASEEANQCAVVNMRAKFPDVSIVGHYSPPFRPRTQADDEEIIQRVRAAKPDVVFVAFGCPKAEKWIAQHYRNLGVPVLIGVGATIDFLAGRVRRAPVWMQRGGLEWFFRLCLEPKRLARRYSKDFWCFAVGFGEQWWRTGRRGSGKRAPAHTCAASFNGAWMRVQTPARLDFEAVKASDPIRLAPGQTHCLVDLSQTQFMDSTGVGLLLRLRRRCRMAGGDLVLVSPSASVTRLLKSMGLQDCFLTVLDAAELLRSGSQLQTPQGSTEPRPASGDSPLSEASAVTAVAA
jgi:N-acetylglucosaminyldiphosphoundecaprenol N-acetyl-beta-D-mannosaminyltransferase